MCRVVIECETEPVKKRDLPVFQIQAHSVRAAVETLHHIGFTARPFYVIGRTTGKRAKKQVSAEMANIDHKRKASFAGRVSNATP